MATRFSLPVAWALGALLALGPAAPSHAGVDVSIGLNIPLIGHGHLPRGAVGVTIGGGRYWRHGGRYDQPWGSSWMLVAPPVVLAAPWVVDAPRPAPVPAAETLPVPASKPDPVIYPRNGQSAEQTEADRQACNRWATTQPAAMADASVFHRAVEACMDGRGYTMK